MKWTVHRHNSLPKLAWLAECSSRSVSLEVGRAVEVGADWIFEGAWSGPFREQQFGTAATVSGSGTELKGDSVLFVSPSHTLEALFYHLANERLLVSNSLAFLIEALGAQVRYDPRIAKRLASAVLGVRDYQTHVLNTDKGGISRLLYCNMRWVPGGGLEFERKPDPFAFRSYQDYRETLSSELGALFANAADQGRTRHYAPVSTCSSGYDSTACLVLASEFGCSRAVTLDTARSEVDDSGTHIAEHLGISVQNFPRREIGRREEVEEFVATGMGGEDVIFAAFEPAIGDSVLLTGFHGDKIWGKGVKPNSVLARGDVSGSNFAEFRLRTGFIHVPVPFIGALHHPELAAISNSRNMSQWSVGGWYDRPIPRRIAEDAGVPRNAFGSEKKAASQLLFLAPEVQPSAFTDAARAEVAALPFSSRLSASIRERMFKPRLSVVRLLDRAQKLSSPAKEFARLLRDIVGGDPRLLEHDKPSASFEFLAALAAIRKRYSVEVANRSCEIS